MILWVHLTQDLYSGLLNWRFFQGLNLVSSASKACVLPLAGPQKWFLVQQCPTRRLFLDLLVASWWMIRNILIDGIQDPWKWKLGSKISFKTALQLQGVITDRLNSKRIIWPQTEGRENAQREWGGCVQMHPCVCVCSRSICRTNVGFFLKQKEKLSETKSSPCILWQIVEGCSWYSVNHIMLFYLISIMLQFFLSLMGRATGSYTSLHLYIFFNGTKFCEFDICGTDQD